MAEIFIISSIESNCEPTFTLQITTDTGATLPSHSIIDAIAPYTSGVETIYSKMFWPDSNYDINSLGTHTV
jgi:hypothetical protein